MNGTGNKRSIPRILKAGAKRPFLVFWLLFVISFVASGALFLSYRSVFIGSDDFSASTVVERNLFDAKEYQSVFSVWQERKEQFDAAGDTAYPDLFR